MARMNISIPDPLYERLDRLRDRVNASKVCASALEKELDMIEGRTAPADPDIEQLVQRLLGSRERWYDRGREDGKRWAVGGATREQLYQAADELEGEDGEELAHAVRRRGHQMRKIFGSYDFRAAVERWAIADRADDRPAEARTPVNAPDWSATGSKDEEDDEDEDHDERGRPVPRIPPDVDLASYMEGWRDVLQEIWKAVAARLKR
jgi:hypothetical protein